MSADAGAVPTQVNYWITAVNKNRKSSIGTAITASSYRDAVKKARRFIAENYGSGPWAISVRPWQETEDTND